MSNSRYAVAIHILVVIAHFEKQLGHPIRSDDIATSVSTNPVVIRRILKKLKDADLVVSQPGVNGGSGLARPAEDISLCDVYQAMNDDIDMFPVHTGEKTCRIGVNIHGVLGEIFGSTQDVIKGHLSQTSIADVLADILRR